MAHDVIMIVSSTVIISILTFVTNKLMKGLDRHEVAHNLLTASHKLLLKSQILDIYNRMKLEGTIGEHDRNLANELYSAYQAVGGNGYIKDVVKKINKCKGE